MKTLTFFIFFFSVLCFSAQQSRRAPKMAPVYEPGYLVNMKGDTVRGEVQVNPPAITEFYKQFYFRTSVKSKPRLYTVQRSKAYGYDGRHFVMVNLDGNKQYLERLVTGRLRVFEYKHPGKIKGYEGIESEYFIKDTDAEGERAELGELKRIPKKFYKKALKPYFEDQPMLWHDLDKYNFDARSILTSVKEFNQFYKTGEN